MSALTTLLMTTTLLLRPAVSARAEELSGSKIFIDASCHDCHSVDSQGIEKRALPKIQGGDLSTIGDKRKKPDWVRSYLKGKKRGTNGLEHNVTPWVMPDGNRVIATGLPNTVFAGTDEELEILATWLVNLKKGTSGDGAGRNHTESVSLQGVDWSLLLDPPGFTVRNRKVLRVR